MTAKVIMNPFSGRWSALENRERLENALQSAGLDYKLELTERPGHGSEIAATAVRAGFERIIAAGGDGTISEIVNGMFHGAEGGPLPVFGILPTGTANDLADNLGLSKDPIQAAKVLVGDNTHNLDVIRVNERYFVNNAGLGLEPFVTLQQEKMRRLRGNLRYMIATLRAIMQNPSWHMQLEWDDGSYDGPITMISIGNCIRTGGLFYTVPHADPFDGKLTFIYGFVSGRLRIMRALPMIMRPDEGNITEHPAINEVHATWLNVNATTPTPAHADGELFSKSIQKLEYRVLPGRLRLLM